MSETVPPAQAACPSFSRSETIWQGDQISLLFHEDDQDAQAINLIILGRSGHGAVLPAVSITRRLPFHPGNSERQNQIVAGQSAVRPRIPGQTPDFLSRLVALASFMRLSLRKAVHAAKSSAAWREIRASAHLPGH
jgi:hypothetical protein